MKASEQSPDRVIAAMQQLQQCEGLAMLEAEHQAKVDELTASILNPDTSDEATHNLKQQRQSLIDNSPETLVKRIERKARQKFNDYTK